jgi:hypothetical protein
MELVGLLPQPEGDPDWPVEGYKPKSEGLWDTKRFFMHGSLGIMFESTRQASYTSFEFMDPDGVKRKGTPFIYVISKDLGEASRPFRASGKLAATFASSHPTSSTNSGTPLRQDTQFGRRRPWHHSLAKY